MGTNKRYADNIDRRVAARQGATEAALRAAQGPTQTVRAWTPPWRPIRISDVEWIIMRDSTTEPVGVIRVMKLGPRDETFFRVVTWAETSEARSLVGYFRSLSEADQSIRFTPANPVMPDIRLASGWGPMTTTPPQP